MSKETKISASWEKQETIYSDERLTLIVVSFLKFASVARFSIELYRLLVEDQPNIYSYLPCKSENPESIIHCLVQLYIFIIFFGQRILNTTNKQAGDDPAAFRKLMMVSTRRGIQRLFYSKCFIKVLVILTISTFSICVFLHGRMGRTEENEIVGEFPIGIGE